MPVDIVGDENKVNIHDLVIKPNERNSSFSIERDITPQDREEMERIVVSLINSNALLVDGFAMAYQLGEIFQDRKPNLEGVNMNVVNGFIDRSSRSERRDISNFDMLAAYCSAVSSVLPEKKKDFNITPENEELVYVILDGRKGNIPWDQFIQLSLSYVVSFPDLLDQIQNLDQGKREGLIKYLNPDDPNDLDWIKCAEAKIIFKEFLPEDISYYMKYAQEFVVHYLERARSENTRTSWILLAKYLYYFQVLNASDIVLTDHGWHLIQKQEEVRETESSIPERRKY